MGEARQRHFIRQSNHQFFLELGRNTVEAHSGHDHFLGASELELVAEVGGMGRLRRGRQPLVAAVGVLQLDLPHARE